MVQNLRLVVRKELCLIYNLSKGKKGEPMAQLKTEVQKEIERLRNSVLQRTSELDFLQAERTKLLKIQEMLGDGKPGKLREPVAPRSRRRRQVRVDWNAVRKALPATFSADQVSQLPESKGKPKVYLRQLVSRWAKQGKTKRVARGRYQMI